MSELSPLDKMALELESIRSQVSDLTGEVSRWESEAKVYTDQIRLENEEFLEVKAIYAQRINRLQMQKADLEQNAFQNRTRLQSLKNQLAVLERSYRQQIAEAKFAQEIAEREAELDDIIRSFNWFDKAKPHQLEGGKRLAVAKRGLLGDKRGLGKSLTALIYADLSDAKKILCVVPNDTQTNFWNEVQHWAPHRTLVPMGNKKPAERALMYDIILPGMSEYIVIINYEAWRKDSTVIDSLKKLRFDTVICDEAHIMKTRSTNAAKGVRDIVHAKNLCPTCGTDFKPKSGYTDGWGHETTCDFCAYTPSDHYAAPDDVPFDLFCSVKNVLPMTGTPILNKPQDLFSLLNLVNPVAFGSELDFLQEHCEQGWDSKWRFKPGGLDRLADKMKHFYVVRDRHQAGIEIPPQTEQIYNLELDPEYYAEQYEAAKMLNDFGILMLENALGEETNLNLLYVITLILRKRQMMTWPAGIDFVDQGTGIHVKCDVEQSIKIDRIIRQNGGGEWAGLIPEFVAEGERTVLFSQFKKPLIEIQRRLEAAGISVVRYDGDTPRYIADQVSRDFDRKFVEAGHKPQWQVVLAHYKKGGVGLNFTDATQMIILDEEWNPGKVDQAYGRIDRMGQTEETTVHVLRVKDSVDDWMAALIQQKADMIGGFEDAVGLAQQMLEKMKSGQML